LANAALALNIFYPEKSLLDCVELARVSLESGKALEKLRKVTS